MIAFAGNYCDLSLVNEAGRNIDAINSQGTTDGKGYFYVFVGHSLGGTAAQCLANKVPNSRSISLNGEKSSWVTV